MSDTQASAGEPATAELLTGLLKRAAEAHHIYEQNDLAGVHDKDWPQWYAAHMARELAEMGYGVVRAGEARR